MPPRRRHAEVTRPVGAAQDAASPAVVPPPAPLLGLFRPGGLPRAMAIVLGIYLFFVASSYYQEVIYTPPATGPPFRFSVFLVALLCLGNIMMSTFLIGAFPATFGSEAEGNQPNGLERNGDGRGVLRQVFGLPPVVIRQVALASATYVVSMVCTNTALRHVNYPTQVLVKSAKSVPVVLGGWLYFGRRYPLYEYVTVFLVTVSLCVFNFSRSKGGGAQTPLGLALLFASLFCDSLTGPRQDAVLAKHRIAPVPLMALTNVFGAAIAAALAVAVEGLAPLSYVARRPAILAPAALFCATAALGQVCIFFALNEFGSLHLTLITTTRKFFTVLLSVLAFGHRMTALQWACVATIFASLVLQAVCKAKGRRGKASAAGKTAAQAPENTSAAVAGSESDAPASIAPASGGRAARGR